MRRSSFKIPFLVGTFLSLAGGVSAETLVVTASRISGGLEPDLGSLTVVGREELERDPDRSLGEVLESIAGVGVTRTAGNGGVTSVSIRGANAGQTVVQIDGVKVNDPLNPVGSYDFASLGVRDIDSIEVIRGAPNLIRIRTRPGGGPLRTAVSAGYGSFGTWKSSALAAGTASGADWSFQAGLEGARGISAADSALGNLEPDGNRLSRFEGRVASAQGSGMEPLHVEGLFRIQESSFDNDSSGGRGGDDPDYRSRSRELQARLAVESRHSSFWEPGFSVSYLRNRRTSDKTSNPEHPWELHTTFESSRTHGAVQNEFVLTNSHQVRVGAEVEREAGTASEDYGGDRRLLDSVVASGGLAGEYRFSSNNAAGGPAFLAALRLDRHTRAGTVMTYRLAPGYFLSGPGTSLHAALATGFKAPTLYQLDSRHGNSSLLPEQSRSLEIGVRQTLGAGGARAGSAKLEVTAFQLSFQQLIDFNTVTERYGNVGAARTRGVEVAVSSDRSRLLAVTTNYTWMQALDLGTQVPLLRRPRHQGTVELIASPSPSWEASVQLSGRGPADDLDAVTRNRKAMPGFGVVRLLATHAVSRDSRVSGRISNLLDRDYQEVDGYGTPGRSAFVSFEQRW